MAPEKVEASASDKRLFAGREPVRLAARLPETFRNRGSVRTPHKMQELMRTFRAMRNHSVLRGLELIRPRGRFCIKNFCRQGTRALACGGRCSRRGSAEQRKPQATAPQRSRQGEVPSKYQIIARGHPWRELAARPPGRRRRGSPRRSRGLPSRPGARRSRSVRPRPR